MNARTALDRRRDISPRSHEPLARVEETLKVAFNVSKVTFGTVSHSGAAPPRPPSQGTCVLAEPKMGRKKRQIPVRK